MKNPVTFTLITSDRNLSKRYYLKKDGSIDKEAQNLSKGKAKKLTTAFADFAKVLKKITPKQSIVYGTHEDVWPDEVKITTDEKQRPSDNVLARTSDYYKYREHVSALAMFDHDPSQFVERIDYEALLNLLIEIDPQLSKAAYIVKDSASSGVYKTGEQPKKKGYHIWFPVKDASDIPRYGKLIFARLWLNGYGRGALSKSGAFLQRGFIDEAVFSGERLDYVAPPEISGAGLEYIEPEIIFNDGEAIDTSLLTDLTNEESQKLKALIEDAKAKLKPKAEQFEETYKAEKKQELINNGSTPDEATATIERLFKSGGKDLYGNFTLEFKHGILTVSELLKNPKLYDGKSLSDPIEGSSYGQSTAIFYWNKGEKPFINSMAHGGCKYFLHHDEPSKTKSDDWEKKLTEHVAEWNKRHAQVLIGGKHRIMRFVSGDAAHDHRDFYEFFCRNELSRVFDNTLIKVGEKVTETEVKDIYANHVMAWAKHKDSRTFTGGVVFLPGRTSPKNYFNTWRGYSVDPLSNAALIEPIHWHIKHIVCAGHDDLYRYFIQWCAYTFQNPDKPAGAALVLRGQKGVGKGMIGHFLKDIWGNHGIHISNPKHLVGSFNGHLTDVCFLFADEAFYSGDKQHEGVLKALITEPQVIIERKGIDAIPQPNFLKVFMATNSDFAVPASRDERRYCVFDVSSCKKDDRAYFGKLDAVLKDRNAQAAFLFEMLNVDLTGWHTGDIPDSIGLREQRYHSLKSHQKWLVDCLIKGSFDGKSWCDKYASEDLYKHYIEWCESAKSGEYSRTTFVTFSKYLGDVFEKRNHVTGRNKRGVFVGLYVDVALAKFESFEKVCLKELIPSAYEDDEPDPF